MKAAIGLFAAALAGWAGPAVAQAQISEAWTRASTVDVDARGSSARIDAMGGLEASVEDAQNRITPYGFSDNPAGLLADQDSSSIEQSSRYDSFKDRYYDFPHSVVQRRSGITAALRASRAWVLGLEGVYGGVNASRHDVSTFPDNGRFIRDFDILYPADVTPSLAVDNHISANVTAPRLGITYGRKFFKDITLAGRFRYRHENESRAAPNPYEINLTSNQLSLAGGALVAPRLGPLAFTLSGSAAWTGEHVRGLSQGPFNEDHYDWNRPEVSYNAQLGIRYKSLLRGIIDGRHRSNDGEEIAEVNWAAQYFLNPLPINGNNPSESVFKKKWSALLSGLRRNEVATRWMLDVPGTPAHVGVRWRYYRELEWIHPNPTVFLSALPLDVRRLGYEVMSGVSVDLPDGNGLVGTEVHVTREGRHDFTGSVPDIASSELSYHFGGEYKVISRLPVRAGIALIRRDPDRGDGQYPLKGARVSAGLGYFWNAIGTQIDASYSHEHVHYTPGDPSVEISRSDQASIVLRYLF
jgi:hypothetical protein